MLLRVSPLGDSTPHAIHEHRSERLQSSTIHEISILYESVLHLTQLFEPAEPPCPYRGRAGKLRLLDHKARLRVAKITLK